MELTFSLQRKFFDAILSQYAKRTDALVAIASVLKVGKDSVYRRLRGDSIITPGEMELLVREFRISLDSLLFEGNLDTVMFSFNAFAQKEITFHKYLSSVDSDFQYLQHIPNVVVKYASSEIPLFYYCLFPELIAFKLYVWGRTIWDLDFLNGRNFSFELLDTPSRLLAQSIFEKYIKLESIEMWSANLFDNTINQIEYHVQNGCIIERDIALQLLAALQGLAQHMQTMATVGKKISDKLNADTGTPFTLYHNEIIYTNNTIYIESPFLRIVFTTFVNPNYLRSFDTRICDYTHSWFDSVIQKSNLISVQNEKARASFFNGIQRKITLAKNRIETME
ncbi:MAG: hypothetical protein KA974_07930 [Saprospiraceae bacterium]|nr:hypothetical protein [Saprospiraceae bacterium]MBP7699871.1 hypothetical protein [Saprospiraceae bacterium]